MSVWQSNNPGTHVDSIADFILARKLHNRHRASFILAMLRWISLVILSRYRSLFMETEEQNVKRHKKYGMATLLFDGARHLHELNVKLQENVELMFYDNMRTFRMKL